VASREQEQVWLAPDPDAATEAMLQGKKSVFITGRGCENYTGHMGAAA
jgi:hypothetical protein